MKRGTNEKVCAMWAKYDKTGLAAVAQMQNSSGSLYFIGSTIYSYGRHYPIATWVCAERTHDQWATVFVNGNDSTPTTNNHKSSVLSALAVSVERFYVNNVFASTWLDHDKNCKWMLGCMASTAKRWSAARTNRPFYAARLEYLVKQHNDYRNTYMFDGKMVNIAMLSAGSENPLVDVVVSE